VLKAKMLAVRALATGTKSAKRGPDSNSLAVDDPRKMKMNKKLSDDHVALSIPATTNRVLRDAEDTDAFGAAITSIIGGSTMLHGLSNINGATDNRGRMLPGVGADERRALTQLSMSNFYVDAAGTNEPALSEPPPQCMRAVRAVLSQIQSSLQQSVNDITAGGGFLGSDSAAKLAKMAMHGDIAWDEVLKIAKTLRPDSSNRTAGVSHYDVILGWELLEPLMRIVYEAQFGVTSASAGT